MQGGGGPDQEGTSPEQAPEEAPSPKPAPEEVVEDEQAAVPPIHTSTDVGTGAFSCWAPTPGEVERRREKVHRLEEVGKSSESSST